MSPLLSIIIPLYNKQSCILKTINSVLTQDYDDYEIIIVDDGSTDDSVAVVKGITDNRIRLFQKENGGPSSARNYGVQKVQGEWVLFLDADDTLENGALKILQHLSNTHGKYQFFCCNHFIGDTDGKHLYSNIYKNGHVRHPFWDWCSGTLMPRAGAAMFRKEILLTHPFDESLHRYEDAENLFSIMRDVPVYRSSVPIMTYNCTTVAASKPCQDVSCDFIGHLSLKGKSLGEQFALYQLYRQGCILYPNDMNRLYGTQFDKKRYTIANYMVNKKNTHTKWSFKRLVKRCIRKVFRRIIRISYPEIHILQKKNNWDFIGENNFDVQKGNHVLLSSPSHIYHTKIGDYTYIAINAYISMASIGKFCSIGPNILCGWGIHPLNGISTSPMFYSTMKQNGVTLSIKDKIEERKPICIGNDVFIGANVTILDGVTIGDGAVIGAGAVVSKDIPPYAIAVGCPIRIIRYRFDNNKINALKKIEWWNFDEEKLKQVEELFFDVDKFIQNNNVQI